MSDYAVGDVKMSTPRPVIQVPDTFVHWTLGIVATLSVAGVIGLFSMANTLNRLDERVAILTKTVAERVDYATQRIDQISKDQRETERRITAIEARRADK